MDGRRIKWRRNVTENFNRLSRVHERYRQTDDRRTDLRRHIACLRSLKQFLALGDCAQTHVCEQLAHNRYIKWKGRHGSRDLRPSNAIQTPRNHATEVQLASVSR